MEEERKAGKLAKGTRGKGRPKKGEVLKNHLKSNSCRSRRRQETSPTVPGGDAQRALIAASSKVNERIF
jgi:hypothetical protein